MATWENSLDVLDDECSICADTFKEPIQLSCRHIFCLHCIKRYVKKSRKQKREPSQKLSCPLCRTEFIVPVDGLRTLIITLETENIITCDICTSNPASWTCADCEQNLCRQDLNCHSRLKSTKDHTVLPIPDSGVDRGTLKSSIYCHVHQDKRIELYCKQCDTALCGICFVVQHADHKPIMTLEDAARENLEQIQTFIDKVDQQLADCFQERVALENNKKAFLSNTEEVQQQIFNKIDDIKQRLDGYKNDFVRELDALKISELSTLRTVRERVETRWRSLESFKETLKAAKITAAQPMEIIQLTGEYRSSMAELVETDVPTHKFSTILFSTSVQDVSLSERNDAVGTLSTDSHRMDDGNSTAALTQPTENTISTGNPEDNHCLHTSQSNSETCQTTLPSSAMNTAATVPYTLPNPTVPYGHQQMLSRPTIMCLPFARPMNAGNHTPFPLNHTLQLHPQRYQRLQYYAPSTMTVSYVPQSHLSPRWAQPITTEPNTRWNKGIPIIDPRSNQEIQVKPEDNDGNFSGNEEACARK